MNRLDILIDNVHEHQKASDIDEFKSELLTNNLYFYVINDGSFSSVTEIVWTNKNRPISIPTIDEGKKVYGVLYALKETAITYKENGFKLASMKGLNALEMMHSIKEITDVVIQGKNAKIYLNRKEIKEILCK